MKREKIIFWDPAPCLRIAGAGYDMQGCGQAAGKLSLTASAGVGLLNDSACAVPYYHDRYILLFLSFIDGFKIDERL